MSQQPIQQKRALSVWQSSEGSVLTNHPQYTYIRSEQAAQFGGTAEFKYRSFGPSLLRHSVLKIRVSALTGGTTPEFINKVALHLFRQIDIESGGTAIAQMRSMNLEHIYKSLYDKVHYDEWIAPQIGDDSSANRQTAAGGEQTFYINISHLLNKLGSSFPLPWLSNDELRVVCRFKNLSELVVDGTTASILDARMEIKVTNPGSHIHNFISNVISNNASARALTAGNGRNTWHLVGNRYDQVTQSIPSGVSQVSINLNTLYQKTIRAIIFTVHTAADIGNGVYDNYIAVDNFDLKSGGKHIDNFDEPISNDLYNNIVLSNSRIEGRDNLRNANWYCINYSDAYNLDFATHDQKLSGHGVRDFRHISDAVLNLRFGSTLGAAHVAEITIISHESYLLKNGSLQNTASVL